MRATIEPIRAEVDTAIRRVLDSGVFIGGDEVAAFEAELANTVGRRCAIGVSSGTDALLVTLMALGVGRGDDVITTPLSFFATVGAIVRLGARVVFADVDDDTLTLDPIATATRCTASTRAVIPVHLFGLPTRPVDVPCAVVEDAAQAIGAPLGPIATLSFFPTKTLGALGDAGAVVTDDDALARRIAVLRNHGAQPKYHHVAVGGNFRLDAIQAAVLRVKLQHLASGLAARRRAAAVYRDLFAATPVAGDLRMPPDDPRHTYHQFVIRAPRRDGLRDALMRAGVETAVYYPQPLHLQPCFAGAFKPPSLPIAERACSEVLALPIQQVSPQQQGYVVEQISRFYQ